MFSSPLRAAWKYTKSSAVPQLRSGLKLCTGVHLVSQSRRAINRLFNTPPAAAEPSPSGDARYSPRDFNSEEKAFAFLSPVELESARQWLAGVRGVEVDDDQLHIFVRTIFETQTAAGLEPSLPELPARGVNLAFESYLDEYDRAFGVPRTIPSGWVGLWIGKQAVQCLQEPTHDQPSAGL